MKTRKRETPPGRNPAARKELTSELGLNRIGPVAVLALEGSDGQTHFLRDGPRQEPADRMRLPASGFHQFLRCYASRAGSVASPFHRLESLSILLAYRTNLSDSCDRGNTANKGEDHMISTAEALERALAPG